jgi:hypothetical protein
VGGIGGGEQEDRGQSHRSSLVHRMCPAPSRAISELLIMKYPPGCK